MAINQKDIKLLWGRSGNRCAICQIELSENKKAATASFTLGEQAHIVGEKEGAARGQSLLSESERNSYHNLILLCPNDHTKIDSNPEDWPVEKIHQLKSEHELWVSETLSNDTNLYNLANNLAITSIVDFAVKYCQLSRWTVWTSWALAATPRWEKQFTNDIYTFRQKVIGAIWPDEFSELKAACINFSILLNESAQIFLQHAELQGDSYHQHRFYRNSRHYDTELVRFNEWELSCSKKLIEATKAANYFADIIRRDVNPMFFVEDGKFIVMEGDILGYETTLYEYTKDEKLIVAEENA